MEVQDTATEFEGPVLVNVETETEGQVESKDIGTEFKSALMEMSSEFSKESVSIGVAHEKEKDTVDFSSSVESMLIEVGSETFGEKIISSVDCSTSHEHKEEAEERSSEFVCKLVDSECHWAPKSVEELFSLEEVKGCDTGMEMKSLTVECSFESTLKLIETGMEVFVNSCDASTETEKVSMVEGSSCYEMSVTSVDIEMTEIVEEITALSEDQQKAEIMRTEDESVCSATLMIDTGAMMESNVVDSGSEMTITYVQQSTEWVKIVEKEDEEMETERCVMIDVELSSDVEYCVVDVQCDEKKPNQIESAFETKQEVVDNYSEFKVIFKN